VDYTHGSLTLLTAGAGDAFTDSTTLNDGSSLSGGSEGGAADSHPTWSPDSRWIAFAHGTHSRSLTRDASNNPIPQPGALYLISRDGGAPVRLDHANGGTAGHDSFWPTFSPFSTTDTDGTGYFFLAFYSTRGYGNVLAGAPAGRRQLWVTAVRTTPQGTMDPSSVPYWLPGQDASTANMAAFWTQLPPPM